MARPRFLTNRWIAVWLFLTLLVVYNANGREIGGSDSQPSKFAARALALRGNLLLDSDIARQPRLAERASFVRDLEGHYRSAYSPIASLFGGVTAVALRIVGVDLNAPLGANLIAVLTASALTAAAVTLVFLALGRFASPGVALAVALGLGIGTNFWAMHSRTLAQHEVVAFGFALALFSLTRRTQDLIARHLWIGAVGLGLAVVARAQLAPLAGLIALGLLVRVGWRRSLGPLALTGAMVGGLFAAQWTWFGHPLGGLQVLESLHPEIHNVRDSLNREPWIGAAGLLVSPSRGLLIYSPVVLLVFFGIRSSLRALPAYGLGWGYAGAGLMFIGYSFYSVWWGGHAYGPRYLLDLLVPLTPAAAVALTLMQSRALRSVAAVALAWSIAVAGTGAFFADNWNTTPNEIDHNHARLWDWRDPQILRDWSLGPSPQNFDMFTWESVRQAPQ